METELRSIPCQEGTFKLLETLDGNTRQFTARVEGRWHQGTIFQWENLDHLVNLQHRHHDASYLSAALGIRNTDLSQLGEFYKVNLLSLSQPVASYLHRISPSRLDLNIEELFQTFELNARLTGHAYAGQNEKLGILLIEPKGSYPNTFQRRYGAVTEFLVMQQQLMELIEQNPLIYRHDFRWFDPDFVKFLKNHWDTPFPELLAEFAKHDDEPLEAYWWLTGMISGYPIDSCLQSPYRVN